MPPTSNAHRSRRAWVAAGVLFAAAPGASGCYDYLPVARAPLPRGEVEVALTDSGSVVEAHAVGPASTAIDGTLVADSGGCYVVAVRQVRRRDVDPAPWRGEHVTVPHALVASVRERRFSRTRTTLASVGAAAAVVLVRTAIRGLGGSNSGKSGSGTIPGPK